jgi:galacturan 1,4-alpha-galacturonidase
MKTLQLSALVAGLSVLVSAEAVPKTPQVFAHPKEPRNFKPGRSNRPHGRVCKVTPDVTDAGPAILAAAHKCNHGGTVFLPSGDFVIATALDLTFLDDVDFAIWGNITFKQDIDLWPTQAFQYTYQSASMFWRFGGKNVNIYGDGKGVIDGKLLILWSFYKPILIYRAEGAGQFWWSAMAKNSSVMRPCLLGTDGLHHATISGLKMLNPPGWFNLISNSTDVLVSDMTMLVGSQLTGAPAKVNYSPRSLVQRETKLLIF